jgi:[ribosomal protein S5]-alanine N-acetyltransferase
LNIHEGMGKSNNKIFFETERLIVRPYTKGDADNFFALNGDEEIMRYIRPAKSRVDSDAFLLETIAAVDANPLMGRWAVDEKSTGRFVGSFAVIFIEGTEMIQLGYSLLKKEWGKGYATELTKAGINYVFTVMQLPVIYAVTEIEHAASQQVLLKAGFKPEIIFTEDDKELQRFVLHRRG